MTFGAEIWGPALIQAAGSIGGGLLASSGNQETKMQRTQRKLVDKLISSLTGDGPFSDLYSPDENAFQKSFVEPAQSMFRNKIAPQIQQEYIASGQQRGTGLDDTLTRAGVDLDSLLNQHMYQFQQDALNRKQEGINSILGSGSGAAPSQNLMNSGAGFLSSNSFKDFSRGLFKNNPAELPPQRKGYETSASYAAMAPFTFGGP